MTLQQAEIEALGRDALRLLDLSGPVRAEPYQHEVSRWLVDFGAGGHLGSAFVYDDDPPAEIVVWMLDSLTNDLSEVEGFWGVAFPRCPGHRHPARYEANGPAVLLTCPVSGDEGHGWRSCCE